MFMERSTFFPYELEIMDLIKENYNNNFKKIKDFNKKFVSQICFEEFPDDLEKYTKCHREKRKNISFLSQIYKNQAEYEFFALRINLDEEEIISNNMFYTVENKLYKNLLNFRNLYKY